MKTLILFRHGKSDWDAPYDGDHERPLAPRGKKAAARMGRYLTELGMVPDLVVSSTAVRARKTAARAARAGKWPGDIELESALYHADPSVILEVVSGLPARASTVVLVGHEPTWSMTAEALTGSGPLHVPTAAMAAIQLHVDRWPDVAWGLGRLAFLVTPKSLPDPS